MNIEDIDWAEAKRRFAGFTVAEAQASMVAAARYLRETDVRLKVENFGIDPKAPNADPKVIA